VGLPERLLQGGLPPDRGLGRAGHDCPPIAMSCAVLALPAGIITCRSCTPAVPRTRRTDGRSGSCPHPSRQRRSLSPRLLHLGGVGKGNSHQLILT
jgi:hypothetical protein